MPDSTPEMVERVARAISEQMVYSGYNAETRARLIEAGMGTARAYARAAIVAMSEPTEEMEIVGASMTENVFPSVAGFVWRRMLRAALGKKE